MSNYTRLSIQVFAVVALSGLIGVPMMAYFFGQPEPGSAIDIMKNRIQEQAK